MLGVNFSLRVSRLRTRWCYHVHILLGLQAVVAARRSKNESPHTGLATCVCYVDRTQVVYIPREVRSSITGRITHYACQMDHGVYTLQDWCQFIRVTHIAPNVQHVAIVRVRGKVGRGEAVIENKSLIPPYTPVLPHHHSPVTDTSRPPQQTLRQHLTPF